jgi:hypothetical protein
MCLNRALGADDRSNGASFMTSSSCDRNERGTIRPIRSIARCEIFQIANATESGVLLGTC